MATLPSVRLGAIIATVFTVIYGLRRLLEKPCVLGAADVSQPFRQFGFEVLLFIAAGTLASVHNHFAHGFPLGSGISLIVGCLVIGFFVGLDMALARERDVIEKALALEMALPPPRRLYSITRRFSLVAVTTALFVGVIIVMVLSRDIIWLSTIGRDSAMRSQAQASVTLEIGFILAILLVLVINLIVSYSRNLKLLFGNETEVLELVSRGDLSRMVPVATRDEFGVIAGHTNAMIEGLRHRIQLLTSLKLAEEVQSNLLPSEAPRVPGLDIAGVSLYCDETGGDYYDYLTLPGGRLGVVVADASGHGVDAALHMTTARAFLLFGARDYQGPAALIGAVNRYLTRDSAATSRFMSMFFLEIDPRAGKLRWVRAGHEPALFYDPARDVFMELAGEGMAMGVIEEYAFREYSADGLAPGSLVVVATDGIHEARSEAGEMFGAARVREVIRHNAGSDARGVQTAVIAAVESFRGAAPQEDDITLVVVKKV